MSILKWILIAAGVLLALGAGIYGVGLSLPERHVARQERIIAMPIHAVEERVWAVRDYPSWRPGVTVEIPDEGEDTISYAETKDGDRIAFVLRADGPGRFRSVITDDTLPFGGQWTITLEPRGAVTSVQIEEDSFIRDPLYRFFARFVFGYESTMKEYLDGLEASAAR